jgi:hypothetical protein
VRQNTKSTRQTWWTDLQRLIFNTINKICGSFTIFRVVFCLGQIWFDFVHRMFHPERMRYTIEQRAEGNRKRAIVYSEVGGLCGTHGSIFSI